MKTVTLTLVLLSAVVARAEEKVVSGEYWVPVAEEISEFASFPVKVKFVKGEKTVSVEYDLPLELTGLPNHVKFEGAQGTKLLNGQYGQMECLAPGDFSNCAVNYGNLKFDEQARTALLAAISSGPEEVQKRQMVAMRFQSGGEPAGVLSVRDDGEDAAQSQK